MLWLIFALGSAFFFASSNILAKKILQRANIFDMMFVESALMVLISLFFLPFIDLTISPFMLFLIFIASVLGFLGAFLLNKAYKSCEISTVAPLLNLNPVIIITLSYIILKEVVNIYQMGGIALILVGGYLITLKDIKRVFQPFTALSKKFYLIVLGTLVFWSFVPIIDKVILRDVSPYTLLFYSFVVHFLIQLPVVFRRGTQILSFAGSQKKLIGFITFASLGSHLLVVLALAVPGSFVSLIMPVRRMSTLLIIIFGGNHFKEKNLFAKTIASLTMLAGLFVIGLSS